MTSPGPWVEHWLSPPRFSVYVAATNGDRARALALYEWNAAVSAAMFHDLAHLEIALRNAYDQAIVTHSPAGVPHWTREPLRLFPVDWRHARNGVRIDTNRAPREQIESALASAGGPNTPPGKIIAELSFGFWRYLTISRHHERLWIPFLHRAFASGTSRRAIDEPIGTLHRLRNRVAHHEPLLRHDIVGRHRDLLVVAGALSPDLAAYVQDKTQVPALAAARP